jgi:hypothetical protein
MAKSLGQIHTTKFNYERTTQTGLAIGESNAFLCDNSAKLSTQFNRNIRMMSTYKWVGADLVVQVPEDVNPTGNSDRVILKGRMRYFAPTKGRCQALRDAYQQLRAQAKIQGVDLSKNRQFDFRVTPRALSNYPCNVDDGALPAPTPNNEDIFNTSTLDGSTGLVMVEGAAGVSVFEQYNTGVRPTDNTVAYNSGLTTQAQSGVVQTDFVLNEGLIQSGNPNIADVEFEEIPFELSFDLTARRVYTLQWRPDPALYVSVLGGFVEIVIDEVEAAGATGGLALNGIEMDISMHWAGWKSIARAPSQRKMAAKTTTKK